MAKTKDSDIAYGLKFINEDYFGEQHNIHSKYIDKMKALFTNTEPETIEVEPDMTWSLYVAKVRRNDRFCATYHEKDNPDAVKTLIFGNINESIEVVKETISILTDKVLKGDVDDFPDLVLDLPNEAYEHLYGNKAIEKIVELYTKNTINSVDYAQHLII